MVKGVSDEGKAENDDVTGVAEYLLYQLYMAVPAEFIACIGLDTER